MPTQDQRPWRRKHDHPDRPAVNIPDTYYYPTTREDLVDLIRETESGGVTAEIRACGSHWALSDAALSRHTIVETHEPGSKPGAACLDRSLFDVVPSCMSDRAVEFFRTQTDVEWNETKKPNHDRFYLAHVEAGVRIYELYSRLDRGDDGEPASLAAMLSPRYNGPWAMRTLGGAGGQTIVGALSTGTHGGDVSLPPIADSVQAIHLIGAGNQEYWIEAELVAGSGINLVDDDKLRALYQPVAENYPGIKIIRDPKIFDTVLVNVGRFGII